LVVFKVGVLNDRELASRRFNGSANGGALAAVGVVP